MMIKDDDGNATLYVTFIIAVAMLIGLWLFCTPVMNILVGQYNNFIGEGWVSQESSQTFDIVSYAWMAVPALGLVILFAVLIIRSYIMHDGGQ